MDWTRRILCGMSIALTSCGCRHWRDSFSNHSDQQQMNFQQQREVWRVIDKNAPIGSPLATHPETLVLMYGRNPINERAAGFGQ